jgi:hypothetical protein
MNRALNLAGIIATLRGSQNEVDSITSLLRVVATPKCKVHSSFAITVSTCDLFLQTTPDDPDNTFHGGEAIDGRHGRGVGFSFPFPSSPPPLSGNAEHVTSTFACMCTRRVISLRPTGNPDGHQAGPDGQTRLGRVNQRAGDLNQ